ncbi:hypothetical protein C9374_013093 [Naegleria lovaniensis]|uniref:Uncharacterized protein n=1 Tax=Naegleria lovaniensis TaxID=51637 RepID=A0AA88GF34_NAELO|nr:uncharacterized protein C9374_013093 [Naegleria lovaniensis]KAG2372886.1 hypothetical protein C9374_013093 [Naegleria lovaniensis]
MHFNCVACKFQHNKQQQVSSKSALTLTHVVIHIQVSMRDFALLSPISRHSYEYSFSTREFHDGKKILRSSKREINLKKGHGSVKMININRFSPQSMNLLITDNDVFQCVAQEVQSNGSCRNFRSYYFVI